MLNWTQVKGLLDLEVFKKVYTNSMGLENEKVLIIGDYGVGNRVLSPILTNAYALAARELDLNYSVCMQNAKARGDYADEVLLSTMKKLPPKSAIIMNVSDRIGNLGSLGLSFRSFCSKHGHKFITSSSLGSIPHEHVKTVIKTIGVDYKKQEAKGQKIKLRIDSASEVNVTTKLGTDITFDVKGIKAIVNSGLYTGSIRGGNMPAGEVYLYPNPGKVEGVFYIDGSVRLRNGTRIVRNPIRVDVTKGEIANISNHYEGRLFKETLEWAHRRANNPRGNKKIAELGIGMNPNAKVIGATIIDEKTAGTVHIANGSNSWFGGTIKSIIHLDHVIKDAIVKADGRLIRV